MAFTFTQGLEISQKAKAAGLVTRVKNGAIQFVVGKFNAKGVFQIEREVTGWIDDYQTAMKFADQCAS